MALIAVVGSPQTVSGANGGKVYAFNNITALTTVIAVNVARTTLTFHNPGTDTIYVAPLLAMSGGSSVSLTPSLSNLGGTFAVFPGAFMVITGECQGAWQCVPGAVATTHPLTVMESNV